MGLRWGRGLRFGLGWVGVGRGRGRLRGWDRVEKEQGRGFVTVKTRTNDKNTPNHPIHVQSRLDGTQSLQKHFESNIKHFVCQKISKKTFLEFFPAAHLDQFRHGLRRKQRELGPVRERTSGKRREKLRRTEQCAAQRLVVAIGEGGRGCEGAR